MHIKWHFQITYEGILCRNIILHTCEHGCFVKNKREKMEAQDGSKSQVYDLLPYNK